MGIGGGRVEGFFVLVGFFVCVIRTYVIGMLWLICGKRNSVPISWGFILVLNTVYWHLPFFLIAISKKEKNGKNIPSL